MTLKRVLLLAPLGGLLAIGGCAAAVATSTSYEERSLAYTGGPGEETPPAWTRPCRRFNARYRRAYVLPCGHVRGVVLYRQTDDPDGDADVHAVAMAGHRVVILKSNPGRGPDGGFSGIGHRVDLAGTLTRGRFGLPVVDVRGRAGRPRGPR